MTDQNDFNHWRGVTDSEIAHLIDTVQEIDRKVDSLLLWRAWVLGIAAAISAVVSAAIAYAGR